MSTDEGRWLEGLDERTEQERHTYDEAEHADHGCAKVHGPEVPEHDCREEEVEMSTSPTRSGRITVWGECGVCGRETTPPYADSIL